jgi:hypothetical protein
MHPSPQYHSGYSDSQQTISNYICAPLVHRCLLRTASASLTSPPARRMPTHRLPTNDVGFPHGTSAPARVRADGIEYENTGALDANANTDAACAVCQRPGAVQTYVQWGRINCTNGHTTEYSGLIMANGYGSTSQRFQRSEFVCVDMAREAHATSSSSSTSASGSWFTSEMKGGASDEVYVQSREVSCAVCSIPT